jgi:acetyltransferase-like isoleucine patch superfamily enzyme
MLERLRGFWREHQRSVEERWRRTLPFGDYVVDRWEKARLLGWGEGSSVYDSCVVLGEVRVGREVWVGPNTVLDGSGGGLIIGDHATISAGVQIYTHDTVGRTLSSGRDPIVHAPTQIGARTYLGPLVVVAKGVTIGEGCVIGAHSLVLRDVPAGMKAFGVPCRVVGPARPRVQG